MSLGEPKSKSAVVSLASYRNGREDPGTSSSLAGDENRSRPGTGEVNGATFALDSPDTVEAVWGSGTTVLWPKGEPTMLYGPDGVGKTSVAQQVVLRLIGIGGSDLLGQPIRATEGKALYLALDRPKQAARSLRRMVTEKDREILSKRLVVWQGQLPFDLVKDPAALVAFALERGCTHVVIDSVKDLAPKLSDEDTGTALHRAWQACVEHSVEVFALHHPRKAQGDNKKPKTLADVYGSRWITAGCGSIVLLWGDAGDAIVELEHLKQPADVVGPLTLLHDNHKGKTEVFFADDVVSVVRALGGRATALEVARRMLPSKDERKERANKERARRNLEAAARDGRLKKDEEGPQGVAVYVIVDDRTKDRTGVHARPHAGSAQMRPIKGRVHPTTQGGTQHRTHTPLCSCVDGGAEPAPDGRCSRCWGSLPVS
jgi:replicative DNA helicase